MAIVMGVVMVAAVLAVIVVLPILAFRRARMLAPPDRDERFVQRSDAPMPDRTYLGQGRGGM